MPPHELPPPFFVMGCQGSGNNLVGLILSRHTRISVYLGTHYYVLFAADRHRYGNLEKRSNLARLVRDFVQMNDRRGGSTPTCGDVLAALVEPTFEGVLAAFLRSYAKTEGAFRVGERTSQHYLYLREILAGFPESPVIFTTRDPRDTALALRAGLGTGLHGFIRAWNTAFTSYGEASGRVHLVRYEDLVREPELTVAGICAVLGERYEPEMLRFFERTPARFHALPHHRRLFRPLDATSVGEFRQLSAEEIETIEASCAEGMEAWGYPFVATRARRRPATEEQPRPLRSILMDRLRYYRLDRARWARGILRWRIVLRVRVRYVLLLGFVRRDW